MEVPILDHLIITEQTFFSFLDSGLLDELAESTKYVPAYEMKRRYEKIAEEKGEEKGKTFKAKEIAKVLKSKEVDTDLIVLATGLTKAVINRLKAE